MSSSTIPTSSTATPVNTSKVTGRRQVHFESLDDILADAERLTRGPVRQLGNWSVGQATSHLARTMKMAVDGDPRRAPLPVRMIVRLLRRTHPDEGHAAGLQIAQSGGR